MSVVVYDLETSGTNPSADRIVQFAAVRATDDLSETIAEENFLVALDPEVVPNPEALLVGRLTPSRLSSEGVREWNAVDRMSAFLGQPGTLRVGYNSLAFDDEFVRYANWRNLRSPYIDEWQGGNRRMDAQTLCRAASVLTPNMMTDWPISEDSGLPTYRLGHMIESAGLDFENRAHDALSDSKATLDLLRHIKDHAPRIWDVGVDCTDKRHVASVAEQTHAVLMHVSPFYGNARRCSAPLAFVAAHPYIKTRSIHVDLAAAPLDMLCDLTAEEIADGLFGATDEDKERPPLHQVAHNTAPFLVDLTVSERRRPGAMSRFLERTVPDGPDFAEICRRTAFVDRHREEIAEKVQIVFAEQHREKIDPEMELYAGFVSRDDEARCAKFRKNVLAGQHSDAMDHLSAIEDERVIVLAERLWARAGGAPEDVMVKYRSHVEKSLVNGFGSRTSAAAYQDAVTKLRQDHPNDGELLDDLALWGSPQIENIDAARSGVSR